MMGNRQIACFKIKDRMLIVKWLKIKAWMLRNNLFSPYHMLVKHNKALVIKKFQTMVMSIVKEIYKLDNSVNFNFQTSAEL